MTKRAEKLSCRVNAAECRRWRGPSSGAEYQKPNHVPKEVIDDIAAWLVTNTMMEK
jgi:hypothetical protein